MGSISEDTSSIPTVDISALTSNANENVQKAAAKRLSDTIQVHGCAAIKGHGLSKSALRDAFAMMREVFDLPLEEKMKAPHPDGPTPHRGYLATSKERSGKLGAACTTSESEKAFFAKAVDWKETYDIGHEDNQWQKNIWLPDETFPGFRTFMVSFFERLTTVSLAILEGMMLGMGLNEQECEDLRRIHAPTENQMRLAHYLPMSGEDQSDPNKIRLAAHRDFSSFTLLFQDSKSGLEFQNRSTGEYMTAEPQEGVLYLNIGEFMERFSNGLYPSAMHRVAIPTHEEDTEIPGRYSIPFFVMPSPRESIYPMPSRVERDGKANYEPGNIQEIISSALRALLYKDEDESAME